MEWSTRQLYLLFTPVLCRHDPWETLDIVLAAGVQLVQWRVRDPDVAGLHRCLDLCADHAVPVIVNDHVELATQTGAAGAHVGQGDMPAAVARARLGPGPSLGVSTHDLAQARRAVADGADHIGLGPCFPTLTKGYAAGLPRELLGEVLQAVDVPVFAIGGITPDHLPGLRRLGFRHFAVSGAILAAEHPERVVGRCLESIRSDAGGGESDSRGG